MTTKTRRKYKIPLETKILWWCQTKNDMMECEYYRHSWTINPKTGFWTFHFCEYYGKPITHKLIHKCWEDEKDELVYCPECGYYWHRDDVEESCPECGNTNLIPASEVGPPWGDEDED